MKVGVKVRHSSGEWTGLVTGIWGKLWGNRIITVLRADGKESDWLECCLEVMP